MVKGAFFLTVRRLASRAHVFFNTLYSYKQWLIYWLSFAFIWGYYGWNDFLLFDPSWWFDSLGHLIYGVTGSIFVVSTIKRNSYKSDARFYGLNGRKFWHYTGWALLCVISAGIAWEALELIYDLTIQPNFESWLWKAQRGQIDTMSDLILNTLGAILGIISYRFYEKIIYKKSAVASAEIAEIEEMAHEMMSLYAEIKAKKREHLKHMKPIFVSIIKDLIKERRRDLKDKNEAKQKTH